MKIFFKNQKDISFFVKSFFVSLFIFSWLFMLSFMTATLFIEVQSSSSIINNQNQMFSSDDQTYTVYENADPIIKKLELFLAQNQSKLSQKEIQKIELLRSQRITELMAKKYIDIIEQK